MTIMPPPAAVVTVSIIPFSVPIPVVVVLPAAAIPVPVPVKVPPVFVTRCDPPCGWISWASPISGVPLVVVSSHIPVALDPHEVGAGRWWQDSYHPRRWRGANLDSNGDLAEDG